jgi:uncharacterized protein (DUF4213/DUF364 family)
MILPGRHDLRIQGSVFHLMNLYDALLNPIPSAPIRRIVIGVNWTLVECDHGCGLAQTPRRDAPGCQPIAGAGDLTRSALRDIAERVRSTNPIETTLGMAAINAFHNRRDLSGGDENGLTAFRDVDGPVTVVGRFPGLDRHLKTFRVVEREPREGEFGEDEFGRLAADSVGIVITASTLANRSAERLFEQAAGKRIAIVGPGTPLAPELYRFGVEVLAGSVVEDGDLAATIVAQTGGAQALKQACRYVTLKAPRP